LNLAGRTTSSIVAGASRQLTAGHGAAASVTTTSAAGATIMPAHGEKELLKGVRFGE